MTMLRFLFILFLLLDGLAAAAILGWFNFNPDYDDVEPERITRQVNPEYIELLARLPPVAPLAASAPPQTPDPAPPSPSSPPPTPSPLPVARPTEPLPVASPGLQCVMWNNLNAADSNKLMSLLAAANIKTSMQERETQSAWWVRIPPQPNADAAERHARDLRANGIDDFFIVRDVGPHQYAVSLGVFKTEAAARRHLEQLRSQGVRTATVIPRVTVERQIEVIAEPKRINDALARQQQLLRQSVPCEPEP
jgi:hypothetical protein